MHLKLPTLKFIHLRGDMIEVFKTTYSLYDERVSVQLPFCTGTNTRANNYILRKHFFTTHIVNIYIEQFSKFGCGSYSVNAFKACLDKVMFDFTADFSGTGNDMMKITILQS